MLPSRPTSAWMSSQVATTRPTTARPRTGQSRPGTARPQTAASNEGSHVIAIFEGRGVAREVGMAAIDKDTGKVMLVQVSFFSMQYRVFETHLRSFLARRLSDICQDTSSDASPLAFARIST